MDELNLNQEDLEARSRVSQATISGILRDRTTNLRSQTIVRLAQGLEMPASELWTVSQLSLHNEDAIEGDKKLTDALRALDSIDDQADEDIDITSLPPRLAIEEPREIASYTNAIDEIVRDLDEEQQRAVWLFASGVLAAGVPRVIGRSNSADEDRAAGLSDPG